MVADVIDLQGHGVIKWLFFKEYSRSAPKDLRGRRGCDPFIRNASFRLYHGRVCGGLCPHNPGNVRLSYSATGSAHEMRDEEGVRRHLRSWYRYLDRLDRHFASNAWRVLERYTLADVSIYTTVAISRGFGMPVGERPALSAWMKRMSRRDPVRRAAPDRLPAPA